ncbi:MAG: YfhO family protein [Acidobacteria bacterium]|nr:YfhO family protein [Acidobacteriota bacterium]
MAAGHANGITRAEPSKLVLATKYASVYLFKSFTPGKGDHVARHPEEQSLKYRHRQLLLVCVLIGVLPFADAMIGHRTVVPNGFLSQYEPWRSELSGLREQALGHFDLLFQFLPWAEFFRHSIYSGNFPLWNPYTYLGSPYLANPQTAVFFPLTWIHLIVPPPQSFAVIFAAKLSLFLIGTFLLLRQHGLSSTSSFVGAVLFSLSMHTAASIPYPYSNVTVLLPWILLAIHKTFSNNSLCGFIGTAVAVALSIFAGQPQSVVPLLGAAILFSFFVSNGAPGRARICFYLATACATGLLISAIQWIPTYEYISDSMAVVGPRIAKSGPAYPLSSLITVLIPDFFGTPSDGTFWGYPGYIDLSFYSSILTPFLAAFSFRRRSLRQDPWSAAFLLLLVVSLGLMLGLPILESLFNVPGFRLVGRKKFAFLFTFAMACLAAKGSDDLLTDTPVDPGSRSHRRPVLGAAFIAGLLMLMIVVSLFYFRPFLLAMGTYRKTLLLASRSVLVLITGTGILLYRKQGQRRFLLPLLLLADLGTVGYGLIPRGTATPVYPALPALKAFTDPRPSRVAALGTILPPNSSVVYGFEDIRGYDVLTPRRLFHFLKAIDPEAGDAYRWLVTLDPNTIHQNTLTRRVWDREIAKYGVELTDYLRVANWWYPMLNRIDQPRLFELLKARYLVASPVDDVPAGYSLESNPRGFRVFLNQGTDRAKLFSSWIRSTEQEALQKMNTTDLPNTVVVESDLPPPGSISQSVPGTAERISPGGRGLAFSRYEVVTGRGKVLVEFDRFAPGQKVYVDGRLASLFPADYLFKGVFVPQGRHIVEFRYQPDSLYLGMAGTLLGLVGLLLFVFLHRRLGREYISPSFAGRRDGFRFCAR